MADADAIAAFARTGTVASMQPMFDAAWGGPDGLYAHRLGRQRAAPMNDFAALASAGVALAFGSDAPVTPVGPWAAVQAAVHHRTPGRGLSPRAAFTAHTRGGHRAAGRMDREIGTINLGAPAHLAIVEAGELVRPAADPSVARWSTDPRSRVPLLPDLTPGVDAAPHPGHPGRRPDRLRHRRLRLSDGTPGRAAVRELRRHRSRAGVGELRCGTSGCAAGLRCSATGRPARSLQAQVKRGCGTSGPVRRPDCSAGGCAEGAVGGPWMWSAEHRGRSWRPIVPQLLAPPPSAGRRLVRNLRSRPGDRQTFVRAGSVGRARPAGLASEQALGDQGGDRRLRGRSGHLVLGGDVRLAQPDARVDLPVQHLGPQRRRQRVDDRDGLQPFIAACTADPCAPSRRSWPSNLVRRQCVSARDLCRCPSADDPYGR